VSEFFEELNALMDLKKSDDAAEREKDASRSPDQRAPAGRPAGDT